MYSALMDSPRTLLPPRQALTDASKLVTFVGTVVVIAALYFGRQVLIPLALAVVFAFVLAPIVGLLEKCHLGRVPSVLAVLLVSFALLAVVGWGGNQPADGDSESAS
jgi:predicted PurR-regulated permease PerM